MTTSPNIHTSSGSQQRGCLTQLFDYVSAAYILFLLVYFVVRLVIGDSLWWIALLNAFVIYTFAPLLILLPLTLFMGLWRTFFRLSVFAVLAVVWFGPFFQPKAVIPARRDTITVATFNVWAGSESKDELLNWIDDVEPDVFLLQEADQSYVEAAPSPMTGTFSPLSTWGNVTLSQYGILEYTELTERIQRSVLDVDGQQIVVYNVHMALPLGEPRFNTPFSTLNTISRYDETARNAEIDRLLDFLENETLPHIVAGDFNLSQHSIKYSEIALVLKDSYRNSSSGLGATWPTEYITPLLRIDYIWLSQELRAVRTYLSPDLGSDHLAVVAEIELPEAE